MGDATNGGGDIDGADERSTRRRLGGGLPGVAIGMALYGVVLVVVALWPTPIDERARGLLRALTHAVPALTYDRIEFVANIALFVPFGAGLALLLGRRRLLVVPCALVVSVMIELVHAWVLPARTPAVSDVIANVFGAGIGLLLVAVGHRVLVARRRRSTPPR